MEIFNAELTIILSDHWPDLSVSFHQDGVGEVLLEVVPNHDGESVDVRYCLLYRVKRSIAAGEFTNDNKLGMTL